MGVKKKKVILYKDLSSYVPSCDIIEVMSIGVQKLKINKAITLKVTFKIKITKSGKWYICGNELLDIWTQGKTKHGAYLNIFEVIDEFFKSQK